MEVCPYRKEIITEVLGWTLADEPTGYVTKEYFMPCDKEQCSLYPCTPNLTKLP